MGRFLRRITDRLIHFPTGGDNAICGRQLVNTYGARPERLKTSIDWDRVTCRTCLKKKDEK